MIESFHGTGLFEADANPAPIEVDSASISTLEQAETRVRQIRNGLWNDMRKTDRRFVNARARMVVSREAFGLLGRDDLTPQQISRSTFYLIEARDRVIKSYDRYYSEAPDLWADEMSEKVRAYREAQQPVKINQ